MHLELKEKKTRITYIIGNKINFLGFALLGTPYNQFPYRKSRRIEKTKRVRARILAYKNAAENKLKKFARTKITEIVKNKLNRTNKIEVRKQFTEEFTDYLLEIIKEGRANYTSLRGILRNLEEKLTAVVLGDTNKKIQTLMKHLLDKNLQDEPNFVEEKP